MTKKHDLKRVTEDEQIQRELELQLEEEERDETWEPERLEAYDLWRQGKLDQIQAIQDAREDFFAERDRWANRHNDDFIPDDDGGGIISTRRGRDLRYQGLPQRPDEGRHGMTMDKEQATAHGLILEQIKERVGDNLTVNQYALIEYDFITKTSKIKRARAFQAKQPPDVKRTAFYKLPELLVWFMKRWEEGLYKSGKGERNIVNEKRAVHVQHLQRIKKGEIREGRGLLPAFTHIKSTGEHADTRPARKNPFAFTRGAGQEDFSLTYPDAWTENEANVVLSRIANAHRVDLRSWNEVAREEPFLSRHHTHFFKDKVCVEAKLLFCNTQRGAWLIQWSKWELCGRTGMVRESGVVILEPRVLFPFAPTRGGGQEEEQKIQACPKKQGCGDTHYHEVAKAPKKPKLEGAARRVAEKVLVCKPSEMAKCMAGAECYALFPDIAHFHPRAAARKSSVAPHVRELLKHGMSATQVADAEEERYDRTPAYVEPEEAFDEDGYSNSSFVPTRGGAQSYDAFFEDRLYGSQIAVWKKIDLSTARQGEIARLPGAGFGFARVTKGVKVKQTTGKNLQCYYTACARGDYDEGQKFKDFIRTHRMCPTTWAKTYFTGDVRGGDELMPFAALYFKSTFVVICDGHVKVYPYLKAKYEDARYVHHDSSGVGHYSWCEPMWSGSVLTSIREAAVAATLDVGDAPTLPAIPVAATPPPGLPPLSAKLQREADFREQEGRKCWPKYGTTAEQIEHWEERTGVRWQKKEVFNEVPAQAESPAGFSKAPTIAVENQVSEEVVRVVHHKGEEKLAVVDAAGGLVSQPTRGEILVLSGGHVKVKLSETKSAWYREVPILNPNGSKTDHSEFVRYDSVTQCYGGELLPADRFTIVPQGTRMCVAAGSSKGHHLPGPHPHILVGPLLVCENFVVQSREHEWFKDLRVGLMQTANLLTMGNVFDRNNPFRGTTKAYRTLYVCREMVGYLIRTKMNATLGEMQNKHIATPLMMEYPGCPIDIVCDTLLYFVEYRACRQAELKGTTATLINYLKMDKIWRVEHINPDAGAFLGDIKHGGIHPGVYPINEDASTVSAMHKNGVVCIQRVPYSKSAPEHGNVANPGHAPGGKYAQVSASKGCVFADPHFSFATKAELPKDQYQTVGGCIATKTCVVENGTEEAEKSLLRLTLGRENEQGLRSAQRDALAYSYHLQYLANPQLFDDITRFCQAADPLYDEPAHCSVKHPSDLQILMHILETAYQSVLIPEEEASVEGGLFERIHNYITEMGVKKQMRYKALADHEDELNATPKGDKCVEMGPKPHEGQKYKYSAKHKAVLLKFSRTVAKMQGRSWVTSNPIMMKAMKMLMDTLVVVENNVLKILGYEFPLPFTMRDTWYRATLEKTNLHELNEVATDMREWLSTFSEGLAGTSHGDDQSFMEQVGGQILVTETDIENNDGSYTDVTFRLFASLCHKHGFDPVESIAQLARPICARNPAKYSEKIVVRSLDGMGQLSGHGGTTATNTRQSGRIVFATSLLKGTYQEGAAALGMLITCPVMRKGIDEGTFLSKCTTMRESGEFVCYTELASLFRGLGKIPGDLPGSSKVCITQRWCEYFTGVVTGWVHEPRSLILDQFRRLAGLERRNKKGMEEQDYAYLRRYFPADLVAGEVEYLACIELLDSIDTLCGYVVAADFFDTIMAKRYGMEPVCCKNPFAAKTQ